MLSEISFELTKIIEMQLSLIRIHIFESKYRNFSGLEMDEKYWQPTHKYILVKAAFENIFFLKFCTANLFSSSLFPDIYYENMSTFRAG